MQARNDLSNLSERMNRLEQLAADIRLTLLERQIADIQLTLRNPARRAAPFPYTTLAPLHHVPLQASSFNPTPPPTKQQLPAPLPASIPIPNSSTSSRNEAAQIQQPHSNEVSPKQFPTAAPSLPIPRQPATRAPPPHFNPPAPPIQCNTPAAPRAAPPLISIHLSTHSRPTHFNPLTRPTPPHPIPPNLNASSVPLKHKPIPSAPPMPPFQQNSSNTHKPIQQPHSNITINNSPHSAAPFSSPIPPEPPPLTNKITFLGYIWRQLNAGLNHDPFILQNDSLFHHNRLCIPRGSLRKELISELHREGDHRKARV